MLKNSKKCIFINSILVLSLLISPFATYKVSFANVDISEAMSDGEVLRSIGIIDGDSSGGLLENKTLTRAEMIVIISKLNSQFQDASRYKVPSTFKDVDPNSWYSPYISYAQKKKWASGYKNGYFYPNSKLTTKEAYVFFLKVLGYSTTWESAMRNAESIGLTKDVGFKPSENLLRGGEKGGAFRIIINTLNSKPVGSKKTLSDALGIVIPEPVYTKPAVATPPAVTGVTNTTTPPVSTTAPPATSENVAVPLVNSTVTSNPPVSSAQSITIVGTELLDKKLSVSFKVAKPGENVTVKVTDSAFNSSYANVVSEQGITTVSLNIPYLTGKTLIVNVTTTDLNGVVTSSKSVEIVK